MCFKATPEHLIFAGTHMRAESGLYSTHLKFLFIGERIKKKPLELQQNLQESKINPTACWTEGPQFLKIQYQGNANKSAYQKETTGKLQS